MNGVKKRKQQPAFTGKDTPEKFISIEFCKLKNFFFAKNMEMKADVIKRK